MRRSACLALLAVFTLHSTSAFAAAKPWQKLQRLRRAGAVTAALVAFPLLAGCAYHSETDASLLGQSSPAGGQASTGVAGPAAVGGAAPVGLAPQSGAYGTTSGHVTNFPTGPTNGYDAANLMTLSERARADGAITVDDMIRLKFAQKLGLIDIPGSGRSAPAPRQSTSQPVFNIGNGIKGIFDPQGGLHLIDTNKNQ